MNSQTSLPVYRTTFPNSGALRVTVLLLAAGLLALVATASMSLALAFPMVVSMADRGQITLSSADLQASRQLAGLAWAFVAIGLLHLVAAFGVMSTHRWLLRLAFAISGVGAGLSAAAMVNGMVRGEADALLIGLVLMAVYLFALVAAAARRSGNLS